jgi:hypothetical protein
MIYFYFISLIAGIYNAIRGFWEHNPEAGLGWLVASGWLALYISKL